MTLPLWDIPSPGPVADRPAPASAPASVPLSVPLSYQGGKQRLAPAVVDLWWSTDTPTPTRFVELCCGSGAVSIEMVNRGFPVEAITMVDAGPWGLFWQAVGAGTFNTDRFGSYLDALPADPALIQGALQEMSRQPVGEDAAEVFPILQAGSFGAKALWTTGTGDQARWANTSFRSYWLPTATSSRRSPVNPMMPMPATLRGRVLAVVEAMRGVEGRCADVTEVAAALTADSPSVEGCVTYMDPPYAGTTAYGYGLDIPAVATTMTAIGPVYVSEGTALTDEAHLLSSGRAKGGISGAKKVAHNQEWVSVYRS
jgi:hypothetical protein